MQERLNSTKTTEQNVGSGWYSFIQRWYYIFIFNIKDIFLSRSFYTLIFYDWKKSYKDSVAGFTWVFLKPLFSVFLFFVGNIAINIFNNNDVAPPFVFWTILGMLPWLFISETAQTGSTVISQYSFLLTKLKYNKHKIFSFTLFSKYLQHLVLMILFFFAYVIVYLIFNGQTFSLNGRPITVAITAHLAQLPLIAFLMLFFFYGWTMVLSHLSVMSNDVRQLVSLVIAGVFWISGTFFDINTLENSPNFSWIVYIVWLNPFGTFILMFRDAYVNQIWFFEDINRWVPMLISIGWSIFLIGFGAWISWRTKEWFNDLI